ncbi:hypothetical protein [Allochromatium palmeri]|uniref:DUF4148 domain-containing protein n=1 Tax=Allochromatium palmeri TaxID=231048 RepID=A0A6N8EDY0_9GAMM|nr:hypothetical protein [Allochromatium palmeri]MTW20816.1 hypothetical protein [Allochromatium palmeri]
MKGRNTLLVLVATGLLLSLPVQAQRGGSPGPKFDDRLDRQSSAIQRGIDSGALTRREVKTLRREQSETRQFMRDVRRDGYPPHEARRMIERRLDRVDRQIRKLSNNRDVAPHYRGDRRGPPSHGQDNGRYDDRR